MAAVIGMGIGLGCVAGYVILAYVWFRASGALRCYLSHGHGKRPC